MTKLSYTLGMKVFACFIAVLSGITAFFDGIGIFLANSYDFYSSSLAELKLAHPYLDTGMLTKLYGMRGSLLPILVISLLLFAISVIYLLCAAGHRPDTDEIVPNLQDKIPLDLYFAIVCPILLAILFLILEGRNPLADTGALSFVVIGSIILAILGLATLLTCVTRLKLGRYFYQHTIAYQVIRFCWKMLAAVCSTIADAVKSISTTWKIAVAWLVISAFYTMGGFGAIVLSFALLLVFCSMASQMQELKNGGEELAKGNLNYKINTQRMFPLFRAHGKNLNSISKGFSIALEQKMESEHLKTELITNVSHDIKTPLTSIINYVDLLKKENLDGQAAEYIEVLDRQSRRLKKLTEDLVEASKASTGNLKVQLAPTDMGELAAQAVAEYEEKLENAHLEAVINGGDTPLFAMVDGNLTWRVLSNLLSNACKYSQPYTRVYIDIKKEKDTVILSMKNISRDALNIPAEELMERFVRGDSSRHTEGSGLGLNIAQSLVGLQKGTFSLEIEGDLFKAFVAFPATEPPAPPCGGNAGGGNANGCTPDGGYADRRNARRNRKGRIKKSDSKKIFGSFFSFLPFMMVQLPLHQHAGEALLTHGLINNNGNGIGKIQASCRFEHRNANGICFMRHKNFFGDARAFLPKHDVIIFAVGHISVNMTRLCGCHPDFRIGILFAEVPEIFIIADIQKLPVIQTCALEILILNGKAQRLNQMQDGICHCAGTRDIACVLGNFRLQQNNVHKKSFLSSAN